MVLTSIGFRRLFLLLYDTRRSEKIVDQPARGGSIDFCLLCVCVCGKKKKKCLVLCYNQTNETIISNGEIDAEDDGRRCTVFGNVPPITTNCRRLHAKAEK